MTATAIKERPIPFTAPMVRALLDGRKTQTRRVIARVAGFGQVTEFQRSDTPVYDWTFRCPRMLWQDFREADLLERCPYGRPGDRLWVKETWASPTSQVVAYREGGVCGAWMGDSAGGRLWVHHGYILEAPGYPWGLERLDTYGLRKYGGKWKSGRFMPRWASRITVEIAELRVEPLQDISLPDCAAEGAPATHPDDNVWDSTDTFRELWDSINSKTHPWASNPWVWVIEFRPLPAGK